MSANGCGTWAPTAASGRRDDASGQCLAGTAAMMPMRQMVFWALAVAAFALLLWLLRDILLPFVAGMAIAYLLDPLANRLEKLGVRRLVAALLIVGIFALALLLLGILIVPVLAGQLSALIAKLPEYVAKVQALVTIVSLLVVTPVVAFYFIYDWPRMVAAVDSWVPRPHQETIRALGREINAAIAGFVRGQSGVCLI